MSESAYRLEAVYTGVVPSPYTFQMTSKVVAKFIKIENSASANRGLALCEVEVSGYEFKKG